MKQIPLTQGLAALVDDADYESLSQRKWFAAKTHTGYYYAHTQVRSNDRYRILKMHRLLMDAPPGCPVDHLNHNTLDNQRSNLRVCTAAANSHNRRKHKQSTSQFMGVSWQKPKGNRHGGWVASISVGNIPIYLGFFQDEVEAAIAYDRAVERFRDAYATTNFPREAPMEPTTIPIPVSTTLDMLPAEPTSPPVGVLVFSKDRACQLDLCLSSLTQHLTDGLPPIVVLYATSSPQHAMQYATLSAEYPGVTWHKQQDFQRDVTGIMADWEHVAFVTDDTIFTHAFSLSEAVAAIGKDYDMGFSQGHALGFSLRLGMNIKRGGPPEQAPFVAPALHTPLIRRDEWMTPGDTSFWRWASVGENRGFGYPLEVSSSVYPTATIDAILHNTAYRSDNPNQLETALHERRHDYVTRPMLCFIHSVAFSAVWNAVQAGNGWAQGMTAAEFADNYDKGYRLDWKAYNGYDVAAYHVCAPLCWRADAC